jgi:hypothetical protein
MLGKGSSRGVERRDLAVALDARGLAQLIARRAALPRDREGLPQESSAHSSGRILRNYERLWEKQEGVTPTFAARLGQQPAAFASTTPQPMG